MINKLIQYFGAASLFLLIIMPVASYSADRNVSELVAVARELVDKAKGSIDWLDRDLQYALEPEKGNIHFPQVCMIIGMISYSEIHTVLAIHNRYNHYEVQVHDLAVGGNYDALQRVVHANLIKAENACKDPSINKSVALAAIRQAKGEMRKALSGFVAEAEKVIKNNKNRPAN